jgi:hypothetical protein
MSEGSQGEKEEIRIQESGGRGKEARGNKSRGKSQSAKRQVRRGRECPDTKLQSAGNDQAPGAGNRPAIADAGLETGR